MTRWVVILPAEAAEWTEVFGPYRTQHAARLAADEWNNRSSAGGALVVPLNPPSNLAGTR